MYGVFDFILVMVSLVLAIGVTDLIQRTAETIRQAGGAPPSVLQLAWAASLLLVATLYWWSLWDMRRGEWIFATFFMLLLAPTLLTFAVRLLMSDEPEVGRPFDFERIRLPFMIVMATFSLVVTWDAWIVGTEPAWTVFRPIQIWTIGLYLIGALVRRSWVQNAIAGLVLATYLVAGFVFRLIPGAFGN